MADFTQEEARGYLLTAMLQESYLKPDRHLWGNREATWVSIERAYRFEDEGWEPVDMYRNKVGRRQRRSENIIVHLTHRMGGSEEKTWARVSRDVEAVSLRLRTDTDFRKTSIRCYVDAPTVEISDSGDHVETDLPIRLEYDFALGQVA